MSAIEPNLASLMWFTMLWTLCCIGFLVLSGFFPLKVAAERGQSMSPVLAVFNAGLMAALVGLTVAFGYLELRVTTLIVVMGLVFLFAPAPFEVWPARWRNGYAALAALLVAQVGALGGLYLLAGDVIGHI